MVVIHPGPDDGHHDQLTEATVQQIKHNNAIVREECGLK